jgi:hypothetical protein
MPHIITDEEEYTQYLINEGMYDAYLQHLREIKANYKLYCDSCAGTPLSLENWTHCHINEVSI